MILWNKFIRSILPENRRNETKALLFGAVLGGLALLIAFFSFFQKDSTNTIRNYPNSDTLPALTALNLEHKAQSKSASMGVITFTAGLDNDYYQAQKTNRKAHLYLETKLAAFVNEKLSACHSTCHW